MTVNPRLSAAALLNFTEILLRRLFEVQRLFKTSQSRTLREWSEWRTRDVQKCIIYQEKGQIQTFRTASRARIQGFSENKTSDFLNRQSHISRNYKRGVFVSTRISAAALTRGWRLLEGGAYSRVALTRGWRLLEGSAYSRVALTRGRRLLEGGAYSRAALTRGQRLLEGGANSRAALTRGRRFNIKLVGLGAALIRGFTVTLS